MADPAADITSLAGVRVLEIGHGLGVAAAGLALTAMGAEVAQVRLNWRAVPRAEAAYYDRGRQVLADGTDPDDLPDLGALADVILTDLDDDELAARGLPSGPDRLRVEPTAQVLVSIRSLGRYGPNSHFTMTDLTEWASTGLAQITRRPHDDLGRYVPVLPPGGQAQALAGLAAATAVLAARRWARLRGEPVVADVSVQEVASAMLHGVFPNYVWNGVVTGHPSTKATSLGMLLPAADGDIYLRTLDPRQWDALMAWVDNDTVAVLGAEPDERLANTDAIVMLLSEWSASLPRRELLEEGQRRRIPIALPRNLDDVLAWQQLRARGVWRAIELDGAEGLVPTVPLLEPASWQPNVLGDAAELSRRWEGP